MGRWLRDDDRGFGEFDGAHQLGLGVHRLQRHPNLARRQNGKPAHQVVDRVVAADPHPRAEFGIEPGETTEDGSLSIATARCLGSCGLAPVLVVDGEVLGRETPEGTLEKIKALVGAYQMEPMAA